MENNRVEYMNDLDVFESWHKDLSEWERFQDKLERTSGEKTYYKACNFDNKALKKLQLKNDENQIILYQDDDEITRVSVRFADEDLWLTQNQLADIYCTTKQNISQHIDNILKDGELDANRTVKDFLTVRQEGNHQEKRSIDHYNLDMIIALGYRVQSQVATRFRRWATQRLHEYIQKGFAMDDERLKQGVS